MGFKPTYLYIKQHSITGKLYFGKTVGDPEKYKGSGVHWRRHISKHGPSFVKTLWYHLFHDELLLKEVALEFSVQNNIVKSTKWLNQVYETGSEGGSLPKEGNGVYGKKILNRKPPSKQTRKLLSEAKIRRNIENGPIILSAESKKKISETMKAQYVAGTRINPQLGKKGKLSPHYGKSRTEETKSKISQKLKGENNPMFGKHHTNEFKESRRQAMLGNKNPGKVVYTCPHCGKTGRGGSMIRFHFNNCKIKPKS